MAAHNHRKSFPHMLRLPATFALIASLALGAETAIGATPVAVPNDTVPAPAPTQAAAPATDGAATPDALPATEDAAIHGQATFVDQFHPGFHSAYRGANSLDPGRRGNETWDLTVYGGLRPWQGAEIWVNPEVDQGFGISNTLGIAGYSSAEAYKVGAATPYVRVPRLFFRQTLDLGGEVQGVDPDLNQLGGAQTANRVVLTVGKFGVVDVFDVNKYAHDPRNDFLNWAVVDAGAFDYAADAWGYTYGASVEWYQSWWALRGGLFDGSVTPNSKFLDTRIAQQFQAVVEGEARFDLVDQPGKLKLLGYQTRARLGTFSDLAAFYAANPDATNVDADVARRLRNKFGASLNLEQQIRADLGFFLRASLSDGRTEAYDFTDIDRSVSGGFSMTGTRWNRPDDTVGIAAVVNTISHAHKDYFEQGGLGILVGDGKLTNAGPEQILETYYSYAVLKGVALSADYQFVRNPAYNRDRGPAHIFGGRLHAQF